MRLKDKIAIIFGAGQAPGETPATGNGRATALLYAREGAKVMAVDRNLDSAEETATMIRDEGGAAKAVTCDVTIEDQVKAAIDACVAEWGRINILHNNVGISVEGGDAPITEIESDAFDRIIAVNLRSMVYACKHTLPVMRKQKSGAIVSISSMAAREDYPWVSYKASKSAMIALTTQIAIQNAEFGIRANVILPGLMDTPMAVDRRAEAWGRPREDVAAERDAKIPLLGKMGDAWDVAYASLFLASDEAKFITGVALPVDGGRGSRVG
ncbi:MAG: SDR family NAD(P)-dependent oxidoreductase [Proteobacteria bacterium]|nr:SDR family NAD(P)-dependent oxidoreductase [Pseudomonadota bacterium]MDA1021937.1 SDR family NAD(P)-dependent oxidoreductase [Pseudomonadota bacterium]